MHQQGAWLERFVDKFIWNTKSKYNLSNPAQPISGEVVDWILDGGGVKSKSGVNITSDTALTVSALWRGIQVLGGACSQIPFKSYRKIPNGRRELTADDTPSATLTTKRPNPKFTWPEFMDRAINHLHMRGNHYAYPVRNAIGQVVELWLWHPDTVKVFDDTNRILYKRDGDERVYSSDEVIHVRHIGDGIVGKGIVAHAKDDLGLEISRRDYGSEQFESGGKPGGILSAKNPLTDPQRSQAQKVWDEVKKNSKGRDILLPFGFDYQYATFKPEELQWLEAGDFSIPTIARWTGVPPHKLFDLNKSSYNSIEHQAIEFLQDTIAPILVKFECEYGDKIYQLPIEEKRGYYMEFNMNAYVRADIKTRMESNAVAIHSGQLTPAEARQMENREFKDGSDRLFINQGSGPLDRVDDIIDNKMKSPITPAQKARLKSVFNGKTEEILKTLENGYEKY